MAVIRNLVVKIAADISSLSKGLQTAQKKIQKVSASFTKAGTKLTASITAPLVALGTAAVNVSQGFEQSMANAASVAGATGEELARMTAIARDMGSKTVFSASDAADALYYMASAGYKVDQMADSIEATLNLASATQSDLAFTTDKKAKQFAKCVYQYFMEKDEIKDDMEFWFGNYQYIKDYRNKMTHRNSPSITTISNFDFDFRPPTMFVLKRATEVYLKVYEFIKDLLDEIMEYFAANNIFD